MYYQLGDIEFKGLIGPASFVQKEEANYAEHALINVKPRLQRIGDKLEEIKLEILFSATFCDVEAQIAQLSVHRINGDILPFTIGTGEFIGNFVVKTISKTLKQTDKIGKIIEAELSIVLLEFSPSTSNEAQQSQLNAFANTNNNPPLVPLVPTAKSEAMQLQVQQSGIVSNVTALSTNLDGAKQQPTSVAKYLKKSNAALNGAMAGINQMRAIIQGVKNVLQSAERIKAALEDAARFAQRAKAALDGGDIDGAIQATTELSRSTSRVKYANSESAALVATRKSSFTAQ